MEYQLPDGSTYETKELSKWDLFRLKTTDRLDPYMHFIWPFLTGKWGFGFLTANIIGLYSAYVFEMHKSSMVYSFFVGLFSVTSFGDYIMKIRKAYDAK